MPELCWIDDPDVSLAAARAYYEEVERAGIDPTRALEVLGELEEHAEPLWDHPEGDSLLVLRVVAGLQRVFMQEDRRRALEGPDRIRLRGRAHLLHTRALYRVAGHEREALLSAMALITFAEVVAGSKPALLDILGHTANPVAEFAVAGVGIMAPALRKSGLDRSPAIFGQYRAVCVEIAEAYVGKTGPRTLYPRTFAFANQTFLLLCLHPRHAEDELVDVLYELDRDTRGDDARSQASVPKREAARAKRAGDMKAVVRHVEEGKAVLTSRRLPRQLRELRDVA